MWLVPRKKEEGFCDPFKDLTCIQSEMLRLFDVPFHGLGDFALCGSAYGPAIDVEDTKDHILVRADLPGLSKEEIAVSVSGDTLTIKGGKKKEQEVKEENYIRQERCYGGFNRMIRLPAEVNVEKVKAVYKDGVLELTLPKKEEAKPKHVTVDVN